MANHSFSTLRGWFVNDAEKRPRMVWRILCFYFLMMGTKTPISFFLPMTPSYSHVVVYHLLKSFLLLVALNLISIGFDKRDLRTLGLQRGRAAWLDLAFGTLLGGVVMVSIWLIFRGLSLVEVVPKSRTAPGYPFGALAFLGAFLLFAAVSWLEEVQVRGYLFKNLLEGFSWSRFPAFAVIVATLATSLWFAAMHFRNPNVTGIALFNIALAGVLFALATLATGRLWLALGFHFSWNFVQGTLLGFPVSGVTEAQPFRLVQSRILGSPTWTGGAFGPEGGLAVSLALLVSIAVIAGYAYHRREDSQMTRFQRYEPPAPENPEQQSVEQSK